MCEESMDLTAVLIAGPGAFFSFASSAYHRTLGMDVKEMISSGKSFYDLVFEVRLLSTCLNIYEYVY